MYYIDDFSKCHTCDDTFVGQGTDNAFDACCAADKVLRTNDAGSPYDECVTLIPSCETYVEGGATCAGCWAGSTLSGGADACTCDAGIHATNIDGIDKCATEIPNCKIYVADFSTCATCDDGFTSF